MSETTTDTIREYHALVEFGEPGSVEKFVTDLVAELEALRARLRTTEQDDEATQAVKAGLAYQTLKAWEARVATLEAALAQCEQELASARAEIYEYLHNGVADTLRKQAREELAALATRLAQLEQEPSLMPPGPDRSNPRHEGLPRRSLQHRYGLE